MLPLQFTKPFAVAVAVSVPFPGFIRVNPRSTLLLLQSQLP
jgi:hypothetical protein